MHTSMSERSARPNGFSLFELIFVIGLIGVTMAIAIPLSANALGFFRLSGDARSTSNSIALAKMRASSVFSRTRLFVDLSAKTWHVETWNRTTAKWDSEGTNSGLSSKVSYGYGSASTAPPNTQTTIGQAPSCKDDTGNDIGNTACIIFNSRGAPIDPTGAPTVDALYITDGTAVYGITVSASGMVRTWRTPPGNTPSWVLQ